MGTEAQKAHRAKAASVDERIINAMKRGVIRSNEDLQNFLVSIGQKPDKAWYNRYYDQGPYALYGPSWNPGLQSDFEHDQEIPWQTDPGQTWYDPSKPENWKPTDPLKSKRMSGHFAWRDSPEGQAAAAQYGENAIAAWYAERNKSQYPNAPDMRWFYGADNAAVAKGRPGMYSGGGGVDSINMAPGVDYDVNTGQTGNQLQYQGREGPFNPVPGTPLYNTADKYYNYKYDNVNTALAPAPQIGPKQGIAESRKRKGALLF
jgi:hypothetical protein